VNTSWFLGGGANGGWFNYAPNSSVVFSPGHGIDFYAVGLQIVGLASLIGVDQPDRHRVQHAGSRA
jgi:cytochrome c oxidase subunit 1